MTKKMLIRLGTMREERGDGGGQRKAVQRTGGADVWSAAGGERSCGENMNKKMGGGVKIKKRKTTFNGRKKI